MSPEVRRALNLASRVIEEEALLFYEEAAELMVLILDPEPGTVEQLWNQHAITKGRALSLRALANKIRSLRP